MAATVDELRKRLVQTRTQLRLKPGATGYDAVNQNAAAPPAPAAPPATVAGVGAAALQPGATGAMQPAGLAQTPTPAPGAATLAASSPTLAPTAPPTVTPTAASIPATQRGSSWQGTGPDPRDAQYYADVAKLNSDTNIGLANLDLGQQQQQVAHDTGTAALKHTEDLNLRSTREANARGGIGYSTMGGNAVGEVEYQWATQNAANDQDLSNWLASAELSRKALEQGYTVDEAAALAAAVYRKAQTDAIAAANAPKAPAPAAGPAPPAYPGGPSTNPAYGPSTHPGSGPPGLGYMWTGTSWVKAPKSAGPPPGVGYWWNGVRWVK